MSAGIRIAVIGMGFGREFVPIYQAHPDVAHVGIADGDPERLHDVARGRPGVSVHPSLQEVITSGSFDAVHIATRVDQHATHSIQCMDAGLHCATAVPMGLSLDEVQQVIAAQRRNRVRYMMMETAVYTADFLYAKELKQRGAFGDIQFLQGYHSQDLTGFPAVWRGFPPMWYITHALAPLLDIVGGEAARVFCLGSGTAREGNDPAWYPSPVPLATAIFKLRHQSLTAQITRSLFDVAPFGDEGFNIWGSRLSLITAGTHAEVRLGAAVPGRTRDVESRPPTAIRPRADLLPEALASFAAGGHGGSHVHLANEFIASIVADRPAAIDEIKAATWCAPGICAHQSMLRDGEGVDIPTYG